MLFFDLLPADLHIHILQSWIGFGLPALSALDTAFCSRADRRHLLVWLEQACRTRKEAVGDQSEHSACTDMVQCLSWMRARKIPVVGLKLTTRRHVRIGRNATQQTTGNHETTDIADILRLSPQVKCIGYLNSNPFSGMDPADLDLGLDLEEDGPPEDDEQALFWQALASTPLSELQSLSYYSRDVKLVDVQVIQQALVVIGWRLKSLYLTHSNTPDDPRLLTVVGTYCQLLETLSCKPHSLATAADLVELVQNLKHLATLCPYGLDATVQDVQQIVRASAGQLRSLGMNRSQLSAWELMEVLEAFPHLEMVNFGHNSCNKKEHRLRIASLINEDTLNERWERIFAVCPAITALDTSVEMIGESASGIGIAYGSTLRELTLSTSLSSGLPIMQTLLSRCCHLVSFVLTGDAAYVDILKLLGSACGRLERLEITGGSLAYQAQRNNEERHLQRITDVDMEKLLTNCPHMHSVTLLLSAKVTKHILEVILYRRKVFKKLTFNAGAGISQQDVTWFLEQVKELELLPCPTVAILGQL